MIRNSITIGDLRVVAVCKDNLRVQAESLLAELRNVEAERGEGFLKDNVKIQFGWSLLTLKEEGGELVVHEPNFDGDPLRETRGEVSCTLEVLAKQTNLVNALGIEPSTVRFQDKLIVLKGCFQKRRIYMERKFANVGDSGWYVGDAETDEDVSPEYEGLRVFHLLKLRPVAMQFLVLPPGYLVVLDDEKVEAILNEKGQKLLLKALPAELN